MLKDEATLVVGTMRFYLADVGTAAPNMSDVDADRATALAGWVEIGHTSLDSPFELTNEGGETTTKGSLQNSQLRTETSDRVSAVELNLNQFDADTLKMYWGANSASQDSWVYGQTKPKPVQKAILGIAEDGESLFGIHAYKGDVLGNGNFSIADIENLAELPIKFTALQHEGAPGVFGMHPVWTKTTP